MNGFTGRFEGEMKAPEGTEVFAIHPVQEIIDVEEEMARLFEDDYVKDSEQEGASEENEQKNIDLKKQYDPNSKFEVNGTIYETDDNGYIFKIGGELLPDHEYTVNKIKYKTDENGRIISCDYGEAVLTPEGERDNKAQTRAGEEDRREGDQGGHIIARIFGGAKGIENMLAMRGAINQSVYKRMENEIRKALEEGKEVLIKVEVEYEGDSKRPSKIKVTYTIDGKKTEVQYDNDEGSTDLLETLEDEADEDAYNDLKQEIEDAKKEGADISVVAVKKEYDEDGNVTKITVTIRDENSEHPVNEDRVIIPKEAA